MTKEEMLTMLKSINFHVNYPGEFAAMLEMSEERLRPWFESYWIVYHGF